MKNTQRREQWQPVLKNELERWSAKPCCELIAELSETQEYEIEVDGTRYQIEVQMLENTDCYVHVGIAVDDGSIPASLRPLSSRFVQHKSDH